MTNVLIDLECLPGYFGTNCSSRCVYPNYGEGCKNTCDCNVIDCNHVHGCQVDWTQKEITTGWYFNLITCSESINNK